MIPTNPSSSPSNWRLSTPRKRHVLHPHDADADNHYHATTTTVTTPPPPVAMINVNDGQSKNLEEATPLSYLSPTSSSSSSASAFSSPSFSSPSASSETKRLEREIIRNGNLVARGGGILLNNTVNQQHQHHTITTGKSPLIWKAEGAALRFKQQQYQQQQQQQQRNAAAMSIGDIPHSNNNNINNNHKRSVSFSPSQPPPPAPLRHSLALNDHYQHSTLPPPSGEIKRRMVPSSSPSSSSSSSPYYEPQQQQPPEEEEEEDKPTSTSATTATTTVTSPPRRQQLPLPSSPATLDHQHQQSRHYYHLRQHQQHLILLDACRHAKNASEVMAIITNNNKNHNGTPVHDNDDDDNDDDAGITTTRLPISVPWFEATTCMDNITHGQTTLLHVLSENQFLAQALFQERTSCMSSSSHRHGSAASSARRVSFNNMNTTITRPPKRELQDMLDVIHYLLHATRRSAVILLTTRDDDDNDEDDGCIPFEKVIRNWIVQQQKQAQEQLRRQQRPSRTSSLSRLFSTTSWANPKAASANNNNNKRETMVSTTTTKKDSHNTMVNPPPTSTIAASPLSLMEQRRRHTIASNMVQQRPPSRDSWSVSSSSSRSGTISHLQHSSATLFSGGGGATAVAHDMELGPIATLVGDDDAMDHKDDNEKENQNNNNDHDLEDTQATTFTSSNTRDAARLDLFGIYPQVQLTASAYFALTIMSTIVDSLTQAPEEEEDDDDHKDNDCHGGGMQQIPEAREIHDTVIQTMASIPGFLQTILLIQNKNDRQWALSCSLVQAVIRHTNSVGPWLTAMLRQSDQESRVSDAAIDYLQLISNLHPDSFSDARSNAVISTTTGHMMNHQQQHNEHHPHHHQQHRLSWASVTSTTSKSGGDDNKDCLEQEKQQMQDLYDEISRLDDFIPSLLGLGERGVEEAATTRVVRRVLDQMISRPFSVSVVLGDAIFLGLLAASFRQAANNFVLGREFSVVLKWIYVTNAGIFYFVIRELGKAVSLWMITRTAKTYFGSFWNVSDMLCTILALSSTVALRFHYNYYADANLDDTQLLRQLLAVTTAFLWLRVLNLLKAINLQLATFVLAILQITRDILWFCVILVTLVVSFAQAFYTLLVPASCASSSSQMKGNRLQQECRQSEYYLSLYSALLGGFGDLQRSSFTTSFSVFLMVCFTFMVQIILLNVLIAVASDSYEKCLLRAQNLFGRARVTLIAELVSFQNLLRKNPSAPSRSTHPLSRTSIFRTKDLYGDFWNNNRWSPGSVIFFKASTLVVVVWTLAEIIGYLSRERNHGNILLSLGSILVNVLLFVCMIAFLQNRVDGLPSQPSFGTATREERRSSWPWGTSSRMIGVLTSWYDRVAQKAVLRMFGSMQETSSRMSGRHGDYAEEWNGRIMYMQGQMRGMVQDSQTATFEQLQAMERRMTESQDQLRQEILEILLLQHDRRNNVTTD